MVINIVMPPRIYINHHSFILYILYYRSICRGRHFLLHLKLALWSIWISYAPRLSSWYTSYTDHVYCLYVYGSGKRQCSSERSRCKSDHLTKPSPSIFWPGGGLCTPPQSMFTPIIFSTVSASKFRALLMNVINDQLFTVWTTNLHSKKKYEPLKVLWTPWEPYLVL